MLRQMLEVPHPFLVNHMLCTFPTVKHVLRKCEISRTRATESPIEFHPVLDNFRAYSSRILHVFYLKTHGTVRRHFWDLAGVIRILNGKTCGLLDTISAAQPDAMIAASTPAIADLDNDGYPEIVALRAITGLVSFKYNPQTKTYAKWWVATGSNVSQWIDFLTASVEWGT